MKTLTAKIRLSPRQPMPVAKHMHTIAVRAVEAAGPGFAHAGRKMKGGS
jgi:hypothetical protein